MSARGDEHRIRADEDDSSSDDNGHERHGLSGEPIALSRGGAEASGELGGGQYNLMVEDEVEKEAAKKVSKPKKWLKRFQLKALRKFQARSAREALHRNAYPSIGLNDGPGNRAQDFPDNVVVTSKYTALSFVPKVLFEQFRKATSVYFLLITILTAIPVISPISPWTSVLGLLFIIVVAAVREGYEDFLRHRADRGVNHRHYTVLQHADAQPQQVRSANIAVGDWVLLRSGQEVPADCVLISSSDPHGVAYVQTAQLDGESNLKRLQAPAVTAGLAAESLPSLRGSLDCEVPHHQLYEFRATLRLRGANGDEAATVALAPSSLMLRGAFLRNTGWAVGLVAYTGRETKLSLNSNDPPSKMSTLDKRLNLYTLGILAAMTGLSAMLGVFAGIFESTTVDDMWFLDPDGQNGVTVGILSTFSYFILMSYMIPLSLVVSLEIIKVVQTKWMEWDVLLYSDEDTTTAAAATSDEDEDGARGRRRPMTAKTSDLNDELALVRYVFSDKTGTLTENLMALNKCAVRGVPGVFANPLGGELLAYAKQQPAESAAGQNVRLFLTAMAICHSAVVAGEGAGGGRSEFQAASPDEEALCVAAKANRFAFVGRQGTNSCAVRIDTDVEPVPFDILCEFAFTSARRRQSVLVRSPALQGGGAAYLFAKGADAEMLQRLRPSTPALLDESEVRLQAEQQLASFACNGLRTLAYAYRVLSLDQTADFLRGYQAAIAAAPDQRDAAVEAFADAWERDLALLGVTGIEDRLQPGVPETLQALQAANINVWMITGDKQETAVNIGYSCRLLQPDMDVLLLNADSSDRCGALLRELAQRGAAAAASTQQRHALVVDGQTLGYVLANHDIEFLDLALNCQSVIVCRATPIQKANVVKLVRERVDACCLAIGDGANDVSMIQEANVGIGLYGREGSLAARSSDYALHRFAHLQRLLTVHGRYSLIRNAFVVHYSFYKNAAVFLAQVWFAFYCGFSAQSLYDDWLMTLYNIVITSLPPLFVGVFEKDVPEPLLRRHPDLYTRTQSDTLFTLRTLGMWMLAACWHSVVLSFGTFAIWQHNNILLANGQTLDLTAMGNTCLAVSVVVVFLKAALEISYWPWIVHLGLWGSLVIFYGIFAIESELVNYVPAQFNQFDAVLGSGQFWFWLLLAVVLCLLPDFTLKAVQKIFYPERWELLRQRYLEQRRAGAYAVIDDDEAGKHTIDNDDDDEEDDNPFASVTISPHHQPHHRSAAVFDHSQAPRSSYTAYTDKPMAAPLLRDEE